MEPLANFQPNDIIYARVQHAGCSYHYNFARVLKVTPTGKFRIQEIGSKLTGEQKGDDSHRYNHIVPDTARLLDTRKRLLDVHGHCKEEGTWTGLWYKKYEPTSEIFTYSDMGD